MATVSTAQQGSPIGTALFTVTETSTDATEVNLDTGATGGAGLLLVEIDNTASSVASYLNLYDVAGGGSVTPGTTNEDFVFMAPASSRITYACPEGAHYGAGLWAAIVSSPGAATGPSATVSAYILIDT